MSEQALNKIGFKLKQIRTEQFAIIDSKAVAKYQVSTNIKVGIDGTKRIIVLTMGFKFISGTTTFLILEVSCNFEVSETSWKEICKGNLVKLPKNFVTHLSMITVGTARGVLHAKTENTAYNKYLLPTIDLTKLITQDLSVNLVNIVAKTK